MRPPGGSEGPRAAPPPTHPGAPPGHLGSLRWAEQPASCRPTVAEFRLSTTRQEWVDVKGLYFAGSHGFEITGPDGSSLNYTVAEKLLPEISGALRLLREQCEQVAGAMLEDNKYALSVHTRNVSAADLTKAVLNRPAGTCCSPGSKVSAIALGFPWTSLPRRKSGTRPGSHHWN